MKKKNIVSLVLALALGVGIGVVSAIPTAEVSATAVKETALNENFDTATLNSVWTADEGVSQEVVYPCMQLKNMDIWQPGVILQAYEIDHDNFYDAENDSYKPCVISFDVSVKNDWGWLGFFVGARSTGVPFYESNSMWMINHGSTLFFQNDGTQIQDTKNTLNSTPFSSATGSNVATVQFTLRFDYEDEQGVYYNIDYAFGAKGSDLSTPKATYEGVCAETYVGFTSMGNLFIDITDFKITVGEETVFEDDFSEGKVVYPGGSDPAANWRVTHSYGSENVFVGELKTVAFDSVKEGKLFCDYTLVPDKRLENIFQMSFTLFADDKNIQENSYFGVGFGLSNASDYADTYNMAALKFGKNQVSVVKLSNQTETEVSSKTISRSSFNFGNSKGVKVTFTGRYDNSLSIKIGSDEAVLTNMKFDGAFAIAVSDPTQAGKIEIDDFSLDVYKYNASEGQDMAINFEGVKEFEQFGDIYRQHYYDRNIWYMSGSGVSLAPYSNMRNTNYLQLVNAGGKVAFGPKKEQYGDFIVRFDVAVLSDAEKTSTNTAIGIAMGKKNLDTSNENATCVWFSFNGSGTNVSGLNVQTASGDTSVSCALNIWEQRNQTINVMMVVSNRTVKVYCKRATDDISELGILRAEFVDVNTYGYVAFTCNTLDGKLGNCTMTNFSITNLA